MANHCLTHCSHAINDCDHSITWGGKHYEMLPRSTMDKILLCIVRCQLKHNEWSLSKLSSNSKYRIFQYKQRQYQWWLPCFVHLISIDVRSFQFMSLVFIQHVSNAKQKSKSYGRKTNMDRRKRVSLVIIYLFVLNLLFMSLSYHTQYSQ